jgi:hypothetical protein
VDRHFGARRLGGRLGGSVVVTVVARRQGALAEALRSDTPRPIDNSCEGVESNCHSGGHRLENTLPRANAAKPLHNSQR